RLLLAVLLGRLLGGDGLGAGGRRGAGRHLNLDLQADPLAGDGLPRTRGEALDRVDVVEAGADGEPARSDRLVGRAVDPEVAATVADRVVAVAGVVLEDHD